MEMRTARTGDRRWILGILAVFVLFYIVNNGVWLFIDRSSPSYDKGAHAGFALKYLRLFASPTRLSFTKLLAVNKYWPPFFHICSVPFTMVLGFSVSSVAATNFLFLVIAVYSIFKIGERLFDEWVGAGAVALTLLYPMVYAMSRTVLVDFALIAMVALSLHLILATDVGLKGGAWKLGAVLGAAMLTKWTAVVFLMGPALLWLGLSIRRDRPSLRAVVTAASTVALCAAIVALPWYITAFDGFLETARVAFGSDPAQEGDPVRVLESMRWYWEATKTALILPALLVPTLAGVTVCIVRVRPRASLAVLLCWILPALAFFLLIPNKDARFVAPMLPAIALMAAAGLRSVPWKPVRAVVWAAIVTAGVWQFYAISFAWPGKIEHFYTAPPKRENWQVDEILRAIANPTVRQPVFVGFLPDDPDFEPNIFMLANSVMDLGLRIEGIGQRREQIAGLRRYDFIISKTGSISPAYAAAFRPAVNDDLHAWVRERLEPPRITLWRTWPLPDGSLAEVFRVEKVPAESR
jgi:4-amino-4-deoxy-L-arabinose transferase-like glycosyltransferase